MVNPSGQLALVDLGIVDARGDKSADIVLVRSVALAGVLADKPANDLFELGISDRYARESIPKTHCSSS